MRGLRTKLAECFISCLCENFDVLIFVETWLHPDIKDNEFIDNRYIVYRTDRSESNSTKSIGGGVLIAVKKNFQSSKMNLFSELEDLWVTLQINHKILIFCAVYLPPDISAELYETYVNKVKSVCYNNLDSLIFILGDFNLAGVKWICDDEIIGLIPINIRSEKEILICDNFASYDLHQFNDGANCSGNILDLCYSNCDNIVISTKH